MPVFEWASEITGAILQAQQIKSIDPDAALASLSQVEPALIQGLRHGSQNGFEELLRIEWIIELSRVSALSSFGGGTSIEWKEKLIETISLLEKSLENSEGNNNDAVFHNLISHYHLITNSYLHEGQSAKAEVYLGRAVELYKALAQRDLNRFGAALALCEYRLSVHVHDDQSEDNNQCLINALLPLTSALPVAFAFLPNTYSIYKRISAFDGGLARIDSLDIFRSVAEEVELLANCDPQRFGQHLVSPFQNWADVLCNRKRCQEATEVWERAVRFFEPLAMANPQRFGHSFVRALEGLGNVLSILQRFDGAREIYERVVCFIEPLAVANPHSFAQLLVQGFLRWTNALSNLQDHDAALAVCNRTWEIVEPLFLSESTKFAQLLVDVCSGYRSSQSRANQIMRRGACIAYERAVDLIEPLAKNEPSRFASPLLSALLGWASIQNGWAGVEHNQDDCETAGGIYERMVAFAEPLVSKYPYMTNWLITARSGWANALLNQHKYDDARVGFERLLKVVEPLAKETPRRFCNQHVHALNGLADTLIKQDKYDEAQAVYEQVIAPLAEADPSTYGNDVISVLQPWARLLRDQQNYDDATRIYQRIARFAEPLARCDTQRLANTFVGVLADWATMLVINKEHNKAIEVYQRAVALVELHSTAKFMPGMLGMLFGGYSDLLIAVGNWTELMTLHRKYVRLYQSSDSAQGNLLCKANNALDNHAKGLRHQSDVFRDQGRIWDAFKAAGNALALFEQSGAEHLRSSDGYAACLKTLAARYSDIGRPRLAIDYAKQALGIHSAPSGKSTDAASMHLDLAGYHMADMNYAEARHHAESAIKLLEGPARPGGSSEQLLPLLGHSLLKRGDIYNSLGEKAKAISDFRRSAGIFDSDTPNSPGGTAMALVRLATCLSDIVTAGSEASQHQAEIAEALAAVGRAERIFRELSRLDNGGWPTHMLAHCLDVYATACAAASRHQEALGYGREAITLFRVLAGQSPMKYDAELARCISNQVHRLQGDDAKEESEVVILVDSLCSLLLRPHVCLTRLWTRLTAGIAGKLRSHSAALAKSQPSSTGVNGFLPKAMACFLERFDQRIGHTSEEDLEYFSDFSRHYFNCAYLHDRAQLLELAQAVQSRNLQRWLRADLACGIEDDRYKRQVYEAEGELELCRMQLLAMQNADCAEEDVAELVSRMAAAQDRFADARASVVQQYPEYRFATTFAALSDEVVAAQLSPKEALLVFVVLDNNGGSAVGILLRRFSSNAVKRVLLGMPEYAFNTLDLTSLTALSSEFGRFEPRQDNTPRRDSNLGLPVGAGGEKSRTPDLIPLVNNLNDWAQDNLSSKLNGIDRLIICTDTPMHVLPWQSIVLTGSKGKKRCEVVIYPGIPFYLMERERSFVGAPNESPRDSSIVGMVCADSCTAPAQAEIPGQRGAFKPIAHAAVEAGLMERIADLAVAPDANHLVEVCRGKLLDYLHLACHGDHGRGMDSFLKLGQTWSVNQIMASKIRPQVVFLSACLAGKTSRDQLGNAMGIATAFLLRGARVVIGSWMSVPDHWMPIFAALVQYHVRYTFADKSGGYFEAANLAREQFGHAEWPKGDSTEPGFMQFVSDSYADALLSLLPEDADRSQFGQWKCTTLDQCRHIEGPSYAAMTGLLNETARTRWRALISSWLTTALMRIKDSPRHPSRAVLYEISAFIQVYGHPGL